MSFENVWERCQGKYQRVLASALCRRPVEMRNSFPLISFTFDDFPTSAIETGGRILGDHGIAGTYYVALGLLGRDEAAGRMFSKSDLELVVAQGHELGCHTFGHCDPWETDPQVYEASILDNRRELEHIMPGTRFETMSYAISTTPRPATKKIAGHYFACCRAGGQQNNSGIVDLNYVRSFFLERSREKPEEITELIKRNCTERGWLVFSTHDIAARPTKYGCTPELFEQVVKQSVASGARILPVNQALADIRGGSASMAGK